MLSCQRREAGYAVDRIREGCAGNMESTAVLNRWLLHGCSERGGIDVGYDDVRMAVGITYRSGLTSAAMTAGATDLWICNLVSTSSFPAKTKQLV